MSRTAGTIRLAFTRSTASSKRCRAPGSGRARPSTRTSTGPSSPYPPAAMASASHTRRGHDTPLARRAVIVVRQQEGRNEMGGTIEIPGEVRAAFTGELIAPADPGYEQARRVHNGLIDKAPPLIARCRTVPDIVDAVAIGREQATEISVRGGGHNVAGLGVTDGGPMID